MYVHEALSVSGGERRGGHVWTPGFCVMIGGSVERLNLLLIYSNFVLKVEVGIDYFFKSRYILL